MVVPVELAHAVGFWSHRTQDRANRGWNVLQQNGYMLKLAWFSARCLKQKVRGLGLKCCVPNGLG